uniref:SHSP domain-containing protein n=2 Tax=Sparus aurata TaxID=8175 RepID=A0A671WIY4_SPAAU
LVKNDLCWIRPVDTDVDRQSTSSACMEKVQGVSSEDSKPQKASRENKFTGHSYPTGKIQVIGNIFQFTVDVSEFSPEDVVIIFSNNLMEVHAEKLGADGKVTNTFFHKCKLPANVDPLSVTMGSDSSGVLTIRAHRVL